MTCSTSPNPRVFEQAPEGMPPRSRLIGPEPAGTGSARCEGLIGYLVRLARVHHVNPRELVRLEFHPHCRRTGGMRYANFFSDYARTIHGVGPYAEDFLRVMERLTGRNDLRPLTMLPWRSVIPANSPGFLSRNVRWCRHCLLESRTGQEYRPFPLVWSLDAYQVCGIHRTPMADRCPSCGKAQPFVPFLPDQNHCSHCGQWLGFGWEQDMVCSPSVGAARALEDLVAASPGLDDMALTQAWRQCCIRLVGRYGEGAKKVASQALGLTPTAFSTWLVKGQKPSLPQLLQLCRRLDRMPTELLGFRQKSKPTLAVVRATERHAPPPTNRTPAVELEGIRHRLEAIVADFADCRSMADVRRELDVSRGFLAYRFRELCRRQSAKHRGRQDAEVAVRRQQECAVVQEVVRKIAQAGVYPARRRTNQALRAYKLHLIRPELLEAYRQALGRQVGEILNQPPQR